MGERIMRLKVITLFVLWSLFLQMFIVVTGMQAQDKDKKHLIVKSDPPGVMIYFEGENGFVGVTPLTLKSRLIGNYKITAVKSGFESNKLEYFFKGTEKGTMRIKLSPRTRFKAGIRSLVFPGWGQRYSERKWTGILFSLTQLGVGIYTYDTHRKYEKALKDYHNALKDYENLKEYELHDTYYAILVDRHTKAEDVFEKRQTWLFISGGLWIYNFLDSIFFFPSFEKGIFDKSVPGISANFQNDNIGLTLTFSF
jgi:hypothetical protein